jgi:hypothetical protein
MEVAFCAALMLCPASAQAPTAVFTTWPDIVRVTIGASMCTAWSHLAEPWYLIVYCVGPPLCGPNKTSVCQAMEPGEGGQEVDGGWISPNGDEFRWIVSPSKTAAIPALDWQFAATPNGGCPAPGTCEQKGTF